jgi:hypothetical protein
VPQVRAPDRTVLTGKVLSQAVCTAAIGAPVEKKSIARHANAHS